MPRFSPRTSDTRPQNDAGGPPVDRRLGSVAAAPSRGVRLGALLGAFLFGVTSLALPASAAPDELRNAPTDEPSPVEGPNPAGTLPPTAAAAGATEPGPPEALVAALDSLAADAIYSKAVVGIHVADAVTGERVYSWGDDRPLIPASTMKMVTAAVALRTLGAEYRFPTWVLYDGTLEPDGVLKGNVYIKGQGDPTMVIERLWRLVMDLKLHGIHEVRGDIVFDAGYFADSALVPGWGKQEDIEDGPTYFAPLGALSLNYNIAAIMVRPGAPGQAAVAELDTPTAAVVIENHLNTGRAKSRRTLKVERTVEPETMVTTFKLTGSIPADAEPDYTYRALADPLGNYIGAFPALLAQHGIKVKGKLRPGTTPSADVELLYKQESEPLATILAAMNKQSNNFMAEQILRSVGAERQGLPGSTAKGLQEVDAYFAELGIPAGSWSALNGSGLSRGTGLRPSQLTAMLVDMWNDPANGPEFVTSLAVGGRDGTLWSRFRDPALEGRVRGKTGSLTGVHCLSGYVEASDGRTFAFSFLVNDIDGAVSRARKAHDRLVLTLAGSTGSVVDGEEPVNP